MDEMDVFDAELPQGEPEFRPARFAGALGLPVADGSLLSDAAGAVREEYRDSARWKRLRCRRTSVFAERDGGTVFVLHLSGAVEFDWTWEGAVAFRPVDLDDDPRDGREAADYENAAYEQEHRWSGEVLEVDERHGCLFVALDDPDKPPVAGTFFVRPFEYLAVLDALYHEPRFAEVREHLPGRLAAARGGVHPAVAESPSVGLPELAACWRHAWGALWGPPGTGKTYTIGRQVAAVLADEGERVLVVSTTNRATDEAALSIGRAARESCPSLLDDGRILRIGKGAAYRRFVDEGLAALLEGTESAVLAQIDDLSRQLRLIDASDDRASARRRIGELRTQVVDRSSRLFVDPEVRCVVATAFKATKLLENELVREMLADGDAPFTTIVVDEAGLISRAALAALSLLAARRVVVVGDSRQLAPISRIARLLPRPQKTWLAESGLGHLEDIRATPAAIHVLTEQRRMDPAICRVVSEYQYDGLLATAADRVSDPSRLPRLLHDAGRAIWYVVDEEGTDLAAARAERGPGNRSWIRPVTPAILEKLLADPAMRECRGLFVSPFRAQAQAVSKLLAGWGLKGWESSTVHSQQGTEADVVVFDTVHAGSHTWPHEEWMRLANVAISRAREAVVVIASRAEMDEPYLRPLASSLEPFVLARHGRRTEWQRVDGLRPRRSAATNTERNPSPTPNASPSPETTNGPRNDTLGGQLARRRELTPILSHEQQRLVGLPLDGKPRLVRGVAGSGKSVILANWLAKTVLRFADRPEASIWAVYANRSLHGLLRESIEAAWNDVGDGKRFPWERVELQHVRDVLRALLPSASLSMGLFGFDFDSAAKAFLERQEAASLVPRCDALFIDEAQDLGPSALKLLISLVARHDPEDRNSRPAHVFFDNAQNIYQRTTPRWSDFGLDMRGRSTILKESFRSTAPIAELALNVLHRLDPAADSADHREMLRRGLIEPARRGGVEWLRVRFNQVDGPRPTFRTFRTRSSEIEALGADLVRLIRDEKVSPNDIVLVLNRKDACRDLERRLAPVLRAIGVELSVQTSSTFERRPNTLVATTPHSFKGYDAEIVVVPCLDQYSTQDGQVLAANLYVAMTRARSLLLLSALEGQAPEVRRLVRTVRECLDVLGRPTDRDAASPREEAFHDVLDRIGARHERWLRSLWGRAVCAPLFDDAGQVLCEPLFWFEHHGRRYACFAPDQMPEASGSFGIVVLEPGKPVTELSEARTLDFGED